MSGTRIFAASAAALAMSTGGVASAYAASGAGHGGGPCVRVHNDCYATVQAAVNAAHRGDTVHVPAGRFAGGVLITTSIDLAGAGAHRTALVGGDHVLTVGEWMSPRVPTVHISGVTLRGGRASSSPESVDFTDSPGIIAGGGGLEIAAGEDFAQPTVTVSDSVISGNRAVPIASFRPRTPEEEEGWPHCPDGFCSFAGGFGGGIENWGDLTLLRTVVAHNRTGGPLASDSSGAGIYSWGNLSVRWSRVIGNDASAVAPHGRFAEGGGVLMAYQTNLVIDHSAVNANSAVLVSHNPVTNPDGSVTNMLANAGGVHVDDASTVAIRSSHIDRNVAVVDNPEGQADVINAGLQLTLSDLEMSDTTVSGNRLEARHAQMGPEGPDGSALQWCNLGTVRRVRVVGNSTVVHSLAGDAVATAAVFAAASSCNGFDPGPSTLEDSVIKGNTVTAVADGGHAFVLGGGIMVDSSLTMHGVVVSGNVGSVAGTDGGAARGGGIWNGALPDPDGTSVPSNLALDHVRITRNRLVGGPGAQLEGGGVFTDGPIVRRSTVIARNSPDQCFGCDATATGFRSARSPAFRTSSGSVDGRRSGADLWLRALFVR